MTATMLISLISFSCLVIDFLEFSTGGSQVALVVEKAACSVRDMGSIPGLSRSPGGGIGYPLQYSWAALMAQMVKNPPSMSETWVQSLG